MIWNNLKISFRVLSRNKFYTFITTLGMASGLVIALLILLYVQFELSYEDENPLADRLVRISTDLLNGETLIDQDAEMYPPAGPRMLSEFAEVESFVRVAPLNEATVKVNTNFFRETKVFAADSTFFELFNYPLLHGNPNHIFTTPNEAVLTASLALKYFHRTDVVGESIWLSSLEKEVHVTGVVSDSPLNTHLKFGIVISYLSIEEEASQQGWHNNETYTYLLLAENTSFKKFQTNLADFNDRLHAEKLILTERLNAQPIKDIHLYSHKSYEMEPNGDATSVFFLLGVAILVVVIAVVNYINLSTSKSLDRGKEVGIRKVVGSSLSQLRLQFFTESFVVNIFSGLLALVLILIALPAFRHLSGLPQSFHFWNNFVFWKLILVIVILSSILAGIFPALILSSFEPIHVLKGKLSRSAQGLMLRKSLVVFQFAVTIFLLIQTFTAQQQLSFMRAIDLGLDIEHTIVVRSPRDKTLLTNHQIFKDKLLTHPQLQAVSFSSCVPGMPYSDMGSTNANVNLVGALEQQSFNFYLYWIDSDFISTMKMDLLAGENFIEGYQQTDKIIVNEEAIKLWGMSNAEEAIGKRIDLWKEQRTIIGVIRNFHQGSPKESYIPMLFLQNGGGLWGKKFTSIRLQPGNVDQDLSQIKKVYAAVFPDSPFEYFFMDQEFDKQYRSDEQFQNVFGTLTGFAIMISCLGLFGLVSFTVANRTKEIGVRKVLGAEISQIVRLLSRDFISLILISIILSISITYFIIQGWLSRYAFRIELSLWLFLGPALGVLAISMFTIFFKTFQVSSANPVDALKEE